MAHIENSLSRLNKDDIIRLASDYQQKYDIILNKISKELAELRKSYNKLESDLAITKAVNESLGNLGRQCWSNAQYSRRDTLEISGIPENIDDGELEGKVLTVLSKLDFNIDPANVEACHWLKSNNKGKKTILKISIRIIQMRFAG